MVRIVSVDLEESMLCKAQRPEILPNRKWAADRGIGFQPVIFRLPNRNE